MGVSSSTSSFKPEPIGDILKNVIKQLEKNIFFENNEVVKTWNKFVSKKIKLHTKPIGIRSSRLIVNVDSSNWLFELQTKHRGKILKKIKKHLGEDKIKDIKFKIGEIKNVT